MLAMALSGPTAPLGLSPRVPQSLGLKVPLGLRT